MRNRLRKLSANQLAAALKPFDMARTVPRPSRGWLAEIRAASAVSLRELATRLGVSHQTVAYLETAEAEDKITLKKLRVTADALGCDLIYALVPRSGSLEMREHKRAKPGTGKIVTGVERTKGVETQAVDIFSGIDPGFND